MIVLALALAACSGPDSPEPTPTPGSASTATVSAPTAASEPTVAAAATYEPQPPTATTEPTPAPSPAPSPTPTPAPPPGGYNPNVGTQAEAYGYPAVAERFPDGLDFQAASHLLAQRPWLPDQTDLFLPHYYVDSPAYVSAPGPSASEEELTGQLRAFLERRFPGQPERVEAALALLADGRMLTKTPDYRLRVALVALTGTLAESAIERFLSDGLLLEFADLDGSWNGESNTVVGADGIARQHVRISQRHQHEHFALLSVVLSHELIHDDGSISRDEERIAPMIQQLVHMQQLLTDPEIAYQPTSFAQYYNTLTLGRLSPLLENRLTVHDTTGPIWPGSGGTTTSFLAYLDSYLLDQELPESSNPSPLLRELLLALAERGVEVPAEPAFDDATIDFIEHNHAPLGPVELVTIGCILRLEIPACANPPTAQPPAISGLALLDIDGEPLRYLSADEHPYFDGNTLIHGALVVTGDPADTVASVSLEVIEDGAIIATGSLAAEPPGQPFGNDRTLQIGSGDLLFAIASSQFAAIDRTADALLGLRVRVTTASGAEATRDYGDAGKLVRFRGENRYEDRDDARGGDDWITPSALAVLEHFGAEVLIGDISDMNAGPFPPHETHQSGVDIDGWFFGYNERDAATAATLINHLNDPAVGSWIELVYVTYEQADTDPLWLAIRDVTLADGRAARDVILPYRGHDTHFHWRVSK